MNTNAEYNSLSASYLKYYVRFLSLFHDFIINNFKVAIRTKYKKKRRLYIGSRAKFIISNRTKEQCEARFSISFTFIIYF